MAEIIVLRIVHVVGGMFWVGAVLFNSFFLFPALGAAGPAAGAVMAGIQRRRLFVILPVVALLTILAGARLMWITSGGFSAAYFETGRGATFGLGAVAAIFAFLVGVTFGRSTGMRIGAVTQSLAGAQDEAQRTSLRAELGRLSQRNARFAMAMNVLLIVAAVAMAIARYIP